MRFHIFEDTGERRYPTGMEHYMLAGDDLVFNNEDSGIAEKLLEPGEYIILRRTNLGTDGEPNNAKRAARMETILDIYAQASGSGLPENTDASDNLTDMLADLLHWCGQKGVEFEEALDRAYVHWANEGGR